ncbi:transcriptional regulator [Sinorhizobium americanum]|uniref:Transcriptional regulator n=1 Tax=Sinorhizobium americanum TaxID=194963 RepID=A0A2S3YNB0_9HYPH|nr:transcriptional regulator [Sinorhizobium americanum]
MLENKQLSQLARRRKVPDQANAVDAFVGQRIRMRREGLRMDEKNFGAALGVSVAQVRSYEQGTGRVCATQLLTMADVLQVHFSFFFEDALGATDGGVPKTVGGKDVSTSMVFRSRIVRRWRIIRPGLWGGRTLVLSVG